MTAMKKEFLSNFIEKKEKSKSTPLHATGSLAQAGVLSRGTLRRVLEVRLPSEPYRYPRLSPSC